MNMKTIKNLIILSAMAFVFLATNQALAYVPGVWDPQPVMYNKGPAFSKLDTYDTPIYQPQASAYAPAPAYSQVPMLSSNYQTAPKAQATKTVIKKVYIPANTQNTQNTQTENRTSYQAQSNNIDTSNFPPAVTVDSGNPYQTNNLGASALTVKGSGGFMPSSIWQWFLVVLLIFAIIVIARMFARATHPEIHTHTVTSH